MARKHAVCDACGSAFNADTFDDDCPHCRSRLDQFGGDGA